MKTPKFIINNNSKLNDMDLLAKIGIVMNEGLVSGNNNLYCYLTTFINGTVIAFEKTKYGYKIDAWYDEKCVNFNFGRGVEINERV